MNYDKPWRSGSPNKERDSKILKMHEAGATYAALARLFDLSPARIRQICFYAERMRKRLLVKALL